MLSCTKRVMPTYTLLIVGSFWWIMSWHQVIRTSSNRGAYSLSHNLHVINIRYVTEEGDHWGFFLPYIRQLKSPITVTKKKKNPQKTKSSFLIWTYCCFFFSKTWCTAIILPWVLSQESEGSQNVHPRIRITSILWIISLITFCGDANPVSSSKMIYTKTSCSCLFPFIFIVTYASYYTDSTCKVAICAELVWKYVKNKVSICRWIMYLKSIQFINFFTGLIFLSPMSSVWWSTGLPRILHFNPWFS